MVDSTARVDLQRTPAGNARRLLGSAVQTAFVLAYPLVIYLSRTRFDTRQLGGILLGVYGLSMLLRIRVSAGELRELLLQHLPLGLLIGASIATGSRTLLLIVPMFVSLYLFGTFAWSLHRGPPMVERFARMVEDDLPDFTLPYCRLTTAIWCGFLLVNSLAVVLLATAAPIGWWAAYTGAGFYAVLGGLLLAEACFRKCWFRYYGDGWLDRVFARILPAERTANGRRSLAYVEGRKAVAASNPSARSL